MPDVAVAAPLLGAASVLLAASGAAKLREPQPAALVLEQLKLPAPVLGARLLAAGELGVGLACWAVGGRVPALLAAACYAAFAGYVALALLRPGRGRSCGCTGRSDTPPTVAHLALTLGCCAAALLAALGPVRPLWQLAAGPPASVLSAALAGLLGALCWLVISSLPALDAARRAGRG